MKITIYELLGMIKDGKAPKKVKYCDEIFTFNNDDCNFLYKYQVGKCQLFGCCNLIDEVEIIEEPRDIEVCGSLFTKSEYDKLVHSEKKKIPEEITMCTSGIMSFVAVEHITSELKDKINEICDYLKSKGE